MIVSPATTARMVAKATAAMKARNRSPPMLPSPPPTVWASSGPAMLPAASASLIRSAPTSAAAPKPRKVVRM